MTIKVLVVDDSGFFRRRLSEMINRDPRMKVVGTAADGQEAITEARRLRPDVITMDYEMPVMDGITALRSIHRELGTPVMMFSSLTYEGARVTLDALEAGAVDYLPKNFEDISRHPEELQKILCDRLIVVASSRSGAVPASAAPATTTATQPPASPAARTSRKSSTLQHCRLLIIGASTGGPMALQEVLTALPARFRVPILLVQHMPGTFTRAFAERLDRICEIGVREATDGERLQPGNAYLAPGGKQMLVDSRGALRVKVIDGEERLNYRPSLDVTFGSAARELGAGVLGVVLTGMGADGREGARLLKAQGATIWVQDRASCVIYGMPMAVASAGLSDEELSLREVAPRLREEFG